MWLSIAMKLLLILVLLGAYPVFAQTQLWVSVYRGEHPAKTGVRTFSTKNSVNQLQRFRVQNGQTLVVSEKNIVKIPVSNANYADNGEVVIDPTAVAPDRTPVTIASIDGELQVVDATQIDDEGLKLGIPLDINQQVLKGEAASSQNSQLIEVPTGLYITPTLVKPRRKKGQKVNLSAKVISEHSTLDNEAGKQSGVIRLTQSVETRTILLLSQWQHLSDSQTLSYRPALGGNSRVYSTQDVGDQQQAIWVKIEIAR